MSRSKRPALGRGLGALIPERPPERSNVEVETGKRVAIERIEANPDQPRRRFDDQALDELAESIRSQGIIQPIVVTPIHGSGGRFQIVAGERRWRAAQRAGLHEVPVHVRDTPASRRLEIALVENLQRADLDPMEEAHAYEQLIDLHSLTQEDLATRVGKDRSTVANTMRLLKLPEPVQQMVAVRSLGMGHARALLGLDDPGQIVELAHRIVRTNMSARATEAAVRKRNRAGAPETPLDDDQKRHAVIVGDLEERLQRHLGARVRLKTSARGKGPGRIEIPYRDLDELNRLLHLLMGTSEQG